MWFRQTVAWLRDFVPAVGGKRWYNVTVVMALAGALLGVGIQGTISKEGSMGSTSKQRRLSTSRPSSEPLRPKPAEAGRHWIEGGSLEPTAATIRLDCHYVGGVNPYDESIDAAIWSEASEAAFNLRADNGEAEGPKTFVRFVWTKTDLWFYVEVESWAGRAEENNEDRVWLGSNIEFLLAPRWCAEPFGDEYEFLFNGSGGYTDLHWTKGLTLEEAMSWEAGRMQWRVLEDLTFHTKSPGWAFVGRVPFTAFGMLGPRSGDYWGLGLFRKSVVAEGDAQLLAWSPPLNDPPKFHTPTRFGVLVFQGSQDE